MSTVLSRGHDDPYGVHDETQVRGLLRRFLAEFIRAPQFADADDIFARGFVNSLFAMQLVLYVESTFGLSVESEDLSLANFSSVDALTAFVSRKQSEKQ